MREAVSARERSDPETGYMDADRFRALPSVISEDLSKYIINSRANLWVDPCKHWGNQGGSEGWAVGAAEISFVHFESNVGTKNFLWTSCVFEVTETRTLR